MGRSTEESKGWRGRARGERGAALVEFALVLPLFLALVFGIIEFGAAYSNHVAVRQGVREAVRLGVVGNFGPSVTASCSLTGSTGASNDIQNLMCLTKQEIGLDHSKIRVKVISGTSDFSTAGTFSKGDALIVCAMYPLDNLAKFVSPALGGSVLKSKTTMRIESTYVANETGGAETPVSGADWNWCTVTASAP